MNLEQLMAELRKLLESVREYKGLSAEARTEERREQHKSDMAKIKQVESDIADLEEIEATELRLNESAGSVPVQHVPGQRIEVPDQPIYRSLFPLGEQMRDIVLATSPEAGREARADAKSRLQQVEKRAVERHGITNVEQRAAGTGGMVEATAADGGFLLQGETAQDLFTKGFNNNAVLSRTSNRTISSQSVEIIGLKENSRANGSRGGGVRVYTDRELGQMTQSKTQFDKIKIEPKKLTGLYFASDEILEDVPALQGEMAVLFNEDFQFKAQDLVLNGSGAGEPLGVINSNCIVTVAKESGQAADSIVYQNASKMVSRMWVGARNRVWLINQDCIPTLDAMSFGTAQTNGAIYNPAADPTIGSVGSLRGYPVIPVEQCATVGDLNDIMLVDLSQYITANKGGINSAMSIHLKFDYNQTCFRFVYRFDGQPRWSSALTPFKGTNTVAPFINLAART